MQPGSDLTLQPGQCRCWDARKAEFVERFERDPISLELFGEYTQLIAARYGGTSGICQTALHCNIGDLEYIMGKLFSCQSGCLLCSMSLLELEAYSISCTTDNLSPISSLNCKSTCRPLHFTPSDLRWCNDAYLEKDPATVFPRCLSQVLVLQPLWLHGREQARPHVQVLCYPN